jgi:hypothetical protein
MYQILSNGVKDAMESEFRVKEIFESRLRTPNSFKAVLGLQVIRL